MKLDLPYIREHIPHLLLVISTLACIFISVYSLQIGYTIIFQNFFYIPIILACILYIRRGFLFSCVLTFIYLTLMLGFTQAPSIFFEACTRVIFFIAIAGVVTILVRAGKISEETLRELSGFQKNIIANARVWFIVLDQKGIIQLWNTAAEEISGYPAEEVIGKNDIWKLLYPQRGLRLQITETIIRIVKNDKYLENFETTIRTKDGKNKIISWNIKGIPDKDDTISKYIAIGVDVSDQRLVEQKLQESEERFRLVFENMPIGLWMADKTGALLMGNSAGQHIWGAEPHVGQDEYEVFKAWRLPSHEYIQPDDWALGYAVNEGRVTEAELLEIESFDGVLKYVLNWAAPIKNASGEIVGAFVINQDITQNKKDEDLLRQQNEELSNLTEYLKVNEEELQAQLEEIRSAQNMIEESEERWYDLFSRIQSAIAIYQGVDDGDDFRFVDFNPAAEKIEGIKRDDIIGRRVTEVFPSALEFGILDVFKRVWKTGIPEHHDISLYKDDRIEGWRENLIYRLSSGDIVAMYSDVTERKQSEELIRETNAYLENLISIANVPIIVWDSSFRITRLNHACEQLIGRSAEDVIGKSFEILLPPDQIERSTRLLKTTLEGVRWETVGIDIMHLDGSVRSVLWNSATLYTPDGITPVSTIVQGRDITSERRLEYEKDLALVQIQKNLAQLAILNDEIRNPLTIILAYSEMLGDSRASEQIAVQVSRIDEIVTHLDQRWVQSEKVLTAIRKHYRLYVSPVLEPENFVEGDQIKTGFSDVPDVPSERNNNILIEEIQAELYTILD
ncbi:MAG: PAS domain S-box protein, partial [Methanobacteriota archaeon]